MVNCNYHVISQLFCKDLYCTNFRSNNCITVLITGPTSSSLPAASVLLRVPVVCLRGVFAVRASSTMKRGKKTEEATSDGENNAASGSSTLYLT